jgi:hypothetical protein
MKNFTLSQRLVSEFLGTAFLLAVVIGSGIMGENLAGGNIAIALLANTLAMGAATVSTPQILGRGIRRRGRAPPTPLTVPGRQFPVPTGWVKRGRPDQKRIGCVPPRHDR